MMLNYLNKFYGNSFVRLDQLLLHKGLAQSRTQAQKMIQAGHVSVQVAGQWQVASKASTKLDETSIIRVESGDEQRFVSRAGLKLEGAFERVGYSPENRIALDVGQSTGGFTDCLLQQGAERVIGIDVGHLQLAPSIKENPKVIAMEGVNARELNADMFEAYLRPPVFDIIVMDVSFISQSLILPRLLPLMGQGAWLFSLVKPQFEVGPTGIGKGGLVKDASLYDDVKRKLVSQIEALGLCVQDYFESPIQGGDGNREFFLVATRSSER